MLDVGHGGKGEDILLIVEQASLDGSFRLDYDAATTNSLLSIYQGEMSKSWSTVVVRNAFACVWIAYTTTIPKGCVWIMEPHCALG